MEPGDNVDIRSLVMLVMVLVQSQPVVLPVLIISWVAGAVLAFATGNLGR